MPRFKILVQYDGECFKGWQIQKIDRTVQGELEKALTVLNKGILIRVIGSGRTDTGVHATGQTAHFDFRTALNTGELNDALNGNLPGDVRVMDCQIVCSDFHARYSARKRSYLYRCRIDKYLLDRSFTWLTGPLNVNELNQAAEIVLGEHDFTSLSRNSEELDHRRCIVHESVWKADGTIVNYRVTANRFLHHMVRYLVGTMVDISRGRYSLEAFKDLLLNPKANGRVSKAPPQGLVLQNVEYEEYN